MSLNLQTMVRPSKVLYISMILLVQWMLLMKPTPARSAVIHTNTHEKLSVSLATTKYFLGNGKDKIKPKSNGQSNSVDLVDKVKLLMQFPTAIGMDSTLMAAASAFGTVFEIAAVDKLWKIVRELPKISKLDQKNQNSIEYAKSLVDSSMQCQKSYLDSWIDESCFKLNISDRQQNFCDNYHRYDVRQLNLTCSNAPTAIKCSRSEDGSLAWSAIPQCKYQPGDWSSWSNCSQSCGNGTRTRQRSWPHKSEEIQHETCNIECCYHSDTGRQVAVGQTLVTNKYCPGDKITCTENGFVDYVRATSCPWSITFPYGCIQVVEDNPLTWCDARKACHEMGADLVSPDSEADYAALKTYVTYYYGNWYWTSATNRLGYWEFAATNRFLGDVGNEWGLDEPNNLGDGIKECAPIHQSRAYKLADHGCDLKGNFMCEIKL